MGERHHLDVPYEEKDQAKRFGARWDPDSRRWYAPDGADLEGLARWDPSARAETRPYVYVVFGHRECFRCHEQVPVVAIGVPYSSETLFAGCEGADSLSLEPRVDCLPAAIREYLEANSGYRVACSQTMGDTSLMNTCLSCGAMQGDHFLFDEPSGPFRINGAKDLESLTFVKVPVRGVMGMPDAWSSADRMILRYAEGHHETIELGVCETIFVSLDDFLEEALPDEDDGNEQGEAHATAVAAAEPPREKDGGKEVNKAATKEIQQPDEFLDITENEICEVERRHVNGVFNALVGAMCLVALTPYLVGLLALLPVDPHAVAIDFSSFVGSLVAKPSDTALILLLTCLPGAIFAFLMRLWAMPKSWEAFSDLPSPGVSILTVLYTAGVLALMAGGWESMITSHDYVATSVIVGLIGKKGTAWLVALPFAAVFGYALYVRHERYELSRGRGTARLLVKHERRFSDRMGDRMGM